MENYSTTRQYGVQGHYYERDYEVRRSFSGRKSEFAAPSAHDRTIVYGDRIFVRLTPMRYGMAAPVEFSSSTVNDMTEVIGEIRHHASGARGLWKLYVRNVSRGWSVEKPFMLYGPGQRPGFQPAPLSGQSVTKPYSHPDRTASAHRVEGVTTPSGHVIPQGVLDLFNH